MNITIKRVGLKDDEKSYGFVHGSPESRLELVWPLTREVTSLSRYHDVEQRLQRHIAVLSRRGR